MHRQPFDFFRPQEPTFPPDRPKMIQVRWQTNIDRKKNVYVYKKSNVRVSQAFEVSNIRKWDKNHQSPSVTLDQMQFIKLC